MLKKILSIHSSWKRHLASAGVIGLSMLFFLGNSSCSGGNQAMGDTMKAGEPNNTETSEEPADSACAYFYFLWGKSAEAEEKYEEAMEAYEKALVCDPQAVYVSRKLAVLLVNMGKKEQAIVQLEQMIADDPANLQNRLLLGNIYSSIGQKDQARAVYEAILQIAPDDPHTLLMLGALYASDRDYLQAQKILERLVTVDDKSYAGYSYLAKLYRELNYYDKAMEAYEKALTLSWSPMLAYEAADLYEYRQKYDEAIAIYKRLLEEDEANTKIRGRLARLYIVQGKIDVALAELNELKNYASDTAVVDLAIGRVLLDEKRYAEAIALFEQLLKESDCFRIAFFVKQHPADGQIDNRGVRCVIFQLIQLCQRHIDFALHDIKTRQATPDFGICLVFLQQSLINRNGLVILLPVFIKISGLIGKHGRPTQSQRLFIGFHGLVVIVEFPVQLGQIAVTGIRLVVHRYQSFQYLLGLQVIPVTGVKGAKHQQRMGIIWCNLQNSLIYGSRLVLLSYGAVNIAQQQSVLEIGRVISNHLLKLDNGLLLFAHVDKQNGQFPAHIDGLGIADKGLLISLHRLFILLFSLSGFAP